MESYVATLVPMRVLLLTNPAAGQGRGAACVARATLALCQARHDVTPLAVDRDHPRTFGERFRHALASHDALIVAGGDGTLHHALPALVEAGTPVYHLPLGTENLFARHFAMSRDAQRITNAITRTQTCAPLRIDVAHVHIEDTAGGGSTPSIWTRRFAIMLSIGPDASVVARLANVRNGPISHLSYVRPILQELARPWLPLISLRVDGTPIIREQRGMLVVANSPQYAVRVDPARFARVDDGLLDAVFMPARSGLAAGMWLARARLRAHLETESRSPGAAYATGKHIEVIVHDACVRCQMDGEAVPLPQPKEALSMTIGVEPAVLGVMR